MLTTSDFLFFPVFFHLSLMFWSRFVGYYQRILTVTSCLDVKTLKLYTFYRIFLLSSVSRPALESTQPPVQWVPGVLSPGLNHDRVVMLTTHPHLVSVSKMSRSYSSSPPAPPWMCCGTALLYIHRNKCWPPWKPQVSQTLMNVGGWGQRSPSPSLIQLRTETENCARAESDKVIK
jgi:hypothetical protein